MGVIPIVNENDTLAVSVSLSFISRMEGMLRHPGNQIWRQRHPLRDHRCHGSSGLSVPND